MISRLKTFVGRQFVDLGDRCERTMLKKRSVMIDQERLRQLIDLNPSITKLASLLRSSYLLRLEKNSQKKSFEDRPTSVLRRFVRRAIEKIEFRRREEILFPLIFVFNQMFGQSRIFVIETTSTTPRPTNDREETEVDEDRRGNPVEHVDRSD